MRALGSGFQCGIWQSRRALGFTTCHFDFLPCLSLQIIEINSQGFHIHWLAGWNNLATNHFHAFCKLKFNLEKNHLAPSRQFSLPSKSSSQGKKKDSKFSPFFAFHAIFFPLWLDSKVLYYFQNLLTIQYFSSKCTFSQRWLYLHAETTLYSQKPFN